MAERDIISKSHKYGRALNLKMRGLNYKEISEKMVEEGFKKISERTVQRILSPSIVSNEEIANELIAIQLRDITVADVGQRLKYRQELIEVYRPPQTRMELSGPASIEVVFDSGMKSNAKPTTEAKPESEGSD